MGSGHAADMIRSLKVNRSLLRGKKSLSEIRKTYKNTFDSEKTDIKKATPEQLLKIREKLFFDNKKKQIKSIRLLSITFFVVFILAYILLNTTLVTDLIK